MIEMDFAPMADVVKEERSKLVPERIIRMIRVRVGVKAEWKQYEEKARNTDYANDKHACRSCCLSLVS